MIRVLIWDAVIVALGFVLILLLAEWWPNLFPMFGSLGSSVYVTELPESPA